MPNPPMCMVFTERILVTLSITISVTFVIVAPDITYPSIRPEMLRVAHICCAVCEVSCFSCTS